MEAKEERFRGVGEGGWECDDGLGFERSEIGKNPSGGTLLTTPIMFKRNKAVPFDFQGLCAKESSGPKSNPPFHQKARRIFD
ncbi:hypothetical protein V6N12_040396 [Hibiscus sabdariffa]|uniref:Uncharacterized protein n=1 Tax=Hibiscus sabdariffa TaxID=183260 RepID=A0ABR2E3M0_9ROSI